MSLAARGLQFLGGRTAFEWVREVAGMTKFGRIAAWGVVLSPGFRGQSRTLGSLDAELCSRGAFIPARRRAKGFRTGEF